MSTMPSSKAPAPNRAESKRYCVSPRRVGASKMASMGISTRMRSSMKETIVQHEGKHQALRGVIIELTLVKQRLNKTKRRPVVTFCFK